MQAKGKASLPGHPGLPFSKLVGNKTARNSTQINAQSAATAPVKLATPERNLVHTKKLHSHTGRQELNKFLQVHAKKQKKEPTSFNANKKPNFLNSNNHKALIKGNAKTLAYA